MTILITGARGKVGRAVADRPHAAVPPVRAAGTNPAEPTVPAGVEIADVLGRKSASRGSATRRPSGR
ncbi:hypothetical protein ACFU8Q_00610 [Streptomyces sp. NPDC057543]|uniref:hypothetical protein n=1 Tax=Streptomyces sp. NPDC057543 TaxID=3346163 RepID=UPI0036C117BC